MAEGTLIDAPDYVGRLSSALLAAMGQAEIGHERIRETHYRFMVVSLQFEETGHPERQRLVWDVAGRVLNREQLRDVGMIVTMSPIERV